jgi:hypothetical protein
MTMQPLKARMATNAKKHSTKRPAASKPTRAQQRARREYIRRTGHKISSEQVAKILAQWKA